MGSIRNIAVGLPVKDGHDHTEFVPKNKAKKYKTDRWCFDRVVFLKDKKTGKTITQQRIFTILGETGVKIITSYPKNQICTSKTAS